MRADLVLFFARIKWCEKISAAVRPAGMECNSSYLLMFASAHRIGSNVD